MLKSGAVTCINQALTNQKRSFKNMHTVVTAVNDFQRTAISQFKLTFDKLPLKQ